MTMQAAASEVIFGIGAMADKVWVLPTRFSYAYRLQNSKFVIARQWIHFTQCTDNKGLERIIILTKDEH